MKTIELSEVSALTPHVQPGSDEPVIVTQNGHTVAAIVPADEQSVESLLLSINPQFQAALDRSERRLKSEGGLSGAEVRQQWGCRRRIRAGDKHFAHSPKGTATASEKRPARDTGADQRPDSRDPGRRGHRSVEGSMECTFLT